MADAYGYRVRDGFPTEECGPDGQSAITEHQGPWEHRWDFINALLGNGGMIYPWRPNNRARARKSQCRGFGVGTLDGDGFMSYEEAVITISWEPPSRDTPETTDLVSESLQPTTEFITIDPTDFRWASTSGDELLPEEAPGHLVRGVDYLVTQFEVRQVPAAILDLCGCCNAAPFPAWTLGLSFPAETLLYQPPTLSRKITTDGAEAWNVAHRFAFRKSGWNKFWRAKTQQWESIYHKDNGLYRNFPTANFSLLFVAR